jgi:hypothetical protein
LSDKESSLYWFAALDTCNRTQAIQGYTLRPVDQDLGGIGYCSGGLGVDCFGGAGTFWQTQLPSPSYSHFSVVGVNKAS